MTTQKLPLKICARMNTEHMIINDDYVLIDTMYHITPFHQLLYTKSNYSTISLKGHIISFVNW